MITRYVRPAFWTNIHMAELPHSARLLLIGLWCLADREGRLFDNARTIAALVFVEKTGQERNVRRWLDELCPRFITRYTAADDSKVIQINDFPRWQKVHPNERRSDISGNPSVNVTALVEGCSSDVEGGSSDSGDGADAPTDCRAASPLSPSFASPSAASGRCSDASLSVCTEKEPTHAHELILNIDDPRYDPEKDFRVYGSKAFREMEARDAAERKARYVAAREAEQAASAKLREYSTEERALLEKVKQRRAEHKTPLDRRGDAPHTVRESAAANAMP